MALIRPIHGEMSGSIAGNTWSRNKGGQYVRQRRSPTNPNTTAQSRVRNYLASASRAWQGLTLVQREAWKAAAQAAPVLNRLGESVTLTGAAMFNGLASVCYAIGTAPASTPPVTAAPAGLLTLTPTISASTNLSVAFTATPLGAGNRLAVWWTGPGLPTQDPNFAQAKLVGYSAAAQASPAAFTLPAACAAGSVTNIFVAVVDATGRQSAVIKARVTAGA